MLEANPGNQRPFIRAKIAIDSMRDNGFLSAAHALAELIDNSVQSGADRIDILAIEREEELKHRKVKRIFQLGVFDNGCGMSKDTLFKALEFGESLNREDKNGIGKFGFGLPNSSISQCKRVEVWSWENINEINYTYLDIAEIVEGTLEFIPHPTHKDLPKYVLDCLDKDIPNSGTIVLWSDLDRCQWKTAKSIRKHTEDIVGRMYRHFIEKGQISIRFRNYEMFQNGTGNAGEPYMFKANDPLYLMKNTSLPELPGAYKGEALFEIVEEYTFPIKDEHGEEHDVFICGTVVKKDIFEELKKTTTNMVGNTRWGQHAGNNMGLSVVRADRELEMRREFYTEDLINQGKARWSGIELSFPQALDFVFGVSNNKQHAVNLRMLNKSEDAEREGFESEAEYESDLRENDDPKLQIYEVVHHIMSVRKQISARLGQLSYKGTAPKPGEMETPDGQNTVDEINQIINEAHKREEEKNPTDDPNPPSKDELVNALVEKGETKEQASNTAEQIIRHDLKVWIETQPLSTDGFFDVTSKQGVTLLQLNENHGFISRFYEKLDEREKAVVALCLAAWARMEKTTVSENRRQLIENIRRDWGLVLADYLEVVDE